MHTDIAETAQSIQTGELNGIYLVAAHLTRDDSSMRMNQCQLNWTVANSPPPIELVFFLFLFFSSFSVWPGCTDRQRGGMIGWSTCVGWVGGVDVAITSSCSQHRNARPSRRSLDCSAANPSRHRSSPCFCLRCRAMDQPGTCWLCTTDWRSGVRSSTAAHRHPLSACSAQLQPSALPQPC